MMQKNGSFVLSSTYIDHLFRHENDSQNLLFFWILLNKCNDLENVFENKD